MTKDQKQDHAPAPEKKIDAEGPKEPREKARSETDHGRASRSIPMEESLMMTDRSVDTRPFPTIPGDDRTD